MDKLTFCKMPEYHSKETTRILRKVDYRLVPLLTTLYVFSFLDRSNLGNAAIAGMNDDLNLVGHRYNVRASPVAHRGIHRVKCSSTDSLTAT